MIKPPLNNLPLLKYCYFTFYWTKLLICLNIKNIQKLTYQLNFNLYIYIIIKI